MGKTRINIKINKGEMMNKIEIKMLNTELLNLCMWYQGEMTLKAAKINMERFCKLETNIYERIRERKTNNEEISNNSFKYYFTLQKERAVVYRNIYRKNEELNKLILESLEVIENLLKIEKKALKAKKSEQVKKEIQNAQKILDEFKSYDLKDGDDICGISREIRDPDIFYHVRFELQGRVCKRAGGKH